MKFNNLIGVIEPSQSMKRGFTKGEFINLAIGAPDIAPPSEVKQAFKNFAELYSVRYFDTKGSEKARRNVNDFLRLGATDPLGQISLVSGAKFGIYNALNTILSKGEKVGLFPPYWLSYPEINRMLGLESVYFDVKIDKDNSELYYELEAIVSKIEREQLRCIIINNPNNPAGQLFKQDLFDQLMSYCNEKEIWVVLDEVYKDLLFSGESELIANPLKYENLIRIGSLSKSLAIPALRAGYIYGSDKFITNFNLLNQHISTCINSMTNFVFEAVTLKGFEAFKSGANAEYEKRYQIVRKLLKIKGFNVIKVHAGFYVLIDVSNNYNSGEEACELMEKKGVLIAPGTAYGQQFKNYVRLCLTVKEELLRKAISFF